MLGSLGCCTHDSVCRYRTADEMNRWRARDPVMRFQNLLLANDWWNPQQEKDLRLSLRKEVCYQNDAAHCHCLVASLVATVLMQRVLLLPSPC